MLRRPSRIPTAANGSSNGAGASAGAQQAGLPSYGRSASTRSLHVDTGSSNGTGASASAHDAGLPSYGRSAINHSPHLDNSKEPDFDYDSESDGGDGDYFYGGYQSPSAPPRPPRPPQSPFKDKVLPRYGFINRLRIWMTRLMIHPWVLFLLLSVIFFLLATRYRSQQRHLLEEIQLNSIDEAIDAFAKLKENNRKWEREIFSQKGSEREAHARYSSLERSNRMLRKERDQLHNKYESPERRNEELKIVAREDAWKHQVLLLQEATVREARRAATEKFGPGPHYVEVSVQLPTESPDHVRTFLLEMAPLAVMPHSVHLFLEQVSHNLWKDACFYLNGPHVLQAGPQAEDVVDEADGLNSRELALKPFRELELAHLAFPEYSADFPHVPWSIGFTGRPGGPDFYINKMDNTIPHGPGGQYQHDLDEFGDPCFAKVIDGYDTMHAIFSLSTHSDGSQYDHFLIEPVRIVNAVVK